MSNQKRKNLLSKPVLLFYAQAQETPRVVQLTNPLGAGVDIYVVIGRVIQGFLGVVGSIALVIFIYGGILLLTSAGEPDKIKKGKDALLWTTIALAIIFSSYTLVNFVISGLTKGVTK